MDKDMSGLYCNMGFDIMKNSSISSKRYKELVNLLGKDYSVDYLNNLGDLLVYIAARNNSQKKIISDLLRLLSWDLLNEVEIKSLVNGLYIGYLQSKDLLKQ